MKFPIKFNKYTGSFLALGLILWDTKGMFYSGIPVGLIGITILFLYWMYKLFIGKKDTEDLTENFEPTVIFLIAIQAIVLFIGLFKDDYDILHSDTESRYKYLLQGSVIVFSIGTAFLIYQYLSKKNIIKTLIGLIAIAMVIEILSIFCSTKPGIDVFVMLQNACDYLVNFKNPYDARYADMYNGNFVKYYGSINYMTYWPSCVYAGSVFYSILGDYRYAYILVSTILLFALYRYRISAGLSKERSLLFILLWVSSPVLAFTINRGWIDIFTTLPFFLFAYFLSTRKLFLSAIFLGLTISFKLYYLLLTPLVFLYLIQHFDWKKTVQFIVIGGGVFLLTILPSLVINAAQFYQSTVAYYGVMKLARPDSLSWVSYLTRFDMKLVSAGTYFSLAVIGLLYLRFLFSEKTLLHLIEFSGTVLLIFFLCARQAFCNYYFFVLFLYYLGIYFAAQQKHRSGNDAA